MLWQFLLFTGHYNDCALTLNKSILKGIVFISFNKSYLQLLQGDFLSLPLFNVEFFTGPVVAIREMTNTQVTPEFEDFAAA